MTTRNKRSSWKVPLNRSSKAVRLRRHRYQKRWITFMKECHALGINMARKLNPEFKVSRRTIERRFKKYKEEHQKGITDFEMSSVSDSRNVGRQTFSPKEEKEFAEHIRNIMRSGIEIVDKYWIRREAIKYYQKIHRISRSTRSASLAPCPFTASDGWIDSFKTRNNFNKSIPKVVQRLTQEKNGGIIDHHELQFNLCVEVMEAIKKYGLQCVLNFDETPASINEKPRSCWGDGSKNRMKVFSDANPKASISLLPTVTADGERLPLAWIHKGTTTKCLQSFFNIPKEVYSYFSKNGWMNSALMVRYLREIIQPYLNGRPGALIMDHYRAHWTDEVLKCADDMKLQLIKVPKGMTSVCQPLDMHFNGPFKQARQSLWSNERSACLLSTDNVERMVIRAYLAYMSVPPRLISKGFAEICPPLFDEIMHRYRPRNDGC